MSFERDGFFSSQAEAFRRHAREHPLFKAWFDYALGVNRLGYEMLRTWGNPADKSVLALNTSFVRFHKSFQSILILAERGLVPDARAVLRSAVECAIAIHALADDAGFWERMVEAHHRDARKSARISCDKLGASLSADVSARLNEVIADADAYEASVGRKLRDIKWEQVAERHCPVHVRQLLYQVLYRDLSSDGTHATVRSVERLLGVEGGGQIITVAAGPETELVELLRPASIVFILSAMVCAQKSGLTDMTTALHKAVREIEALDGGGC